MKTDITRCEPVEANCEPWANEATERVNEWLTAEHVKPMVERLVKAWNNEGLLAMHLADQLRILVYERLIQDHPAHHVVALIRDVDWGQLAEQYALLFCGVDETELVRRRHLLRP